MSTALGTSRLGAHAAERDDVASQEASAANNRKIADRKDAHLDLCLREQVVPSAPATGLGGYTFEHDALPEIDFDQIDLSVTILGKRLAAPLLIGAMTGGTERAGAINRRLSSAAARVGVGMALGSQRAMLQNPSARSSFAVRDHAPNLPLLLGNLGAVQLNYGVGIEQVARLIDSVGADAINLHLNPLQEAIQPEGDTRFGNLRARLAELIPALPVPALIKEVGAGISAAAARKLSDLPIAGLEVAGVGGTSWAQIESYRTPPESPQAQAGQRMAGFGVPTNQSIGIARIAMGSRLVIASGGVRTGMDVAVALALGADAAALAQPLFVAANESEHEVVRVLDALIYELKVICFCTGSANIEALRAATLVKPGGRWSLPSHRRTR